MKRLWIVLATLGFVGAAVSAIIHQKISNHPDPDSLEPAELAAILFALCYVFATHILAPCVFIRERNEQAREEIARGKLYEQPWWQWILQTIIGDTDPRAKVPLPVSTPLVFIACWLTAWMVFIFGILLCLLPFGIE